MLKWQRLRRAALFSATALALAACGGGDEGGGQEGEAGQELQDIHLVLGWLAEPSRGGYFAALQQGYYEGEGFEMFMDPGTRVSAVQLVAAGRADFGLGDVDELLSARDKGIPVVGLFAPFQTSPRVLLYHQGQPIDDFTDLDGRTVFVDPGDEWWEFVKDEYSLTEVQEQSYTGGLQPFITDEESVNQGFLGQEDLALAEEGIPVDYLVVGDSGFNPYTNVLFTTEEYIEQNPDVVRRMVEASVRGWEYYQENYPEVNVFLQQYNQELTPEAMDANAEAQAPLIYGGDAETNGVGWMTEERWAEIGDILTRVGVLENTVEASTAFTTENLPGG